MFSVDFKEKNDDIRSVAQHVRDLFTNATERPSKRRDCTATVIWNRGFSSTSLEGFFTICMAYQTATYERTHKSAQS